jgi:hypothetical protein
VWVDKQLICQYHPTALAAAAEKLHLQDSLCSSVWNVIGPAFDKIRCKWLQKELCGSAAGSGT